jgi:hypothetical protein
VKATLADIREGFTTSPQRCDRCGLRLESVTAVERRHVLMNPYDHVRRVLMHGRWSPEERAWLAAHLLRQGITMPGESPSPLPPPRGTEVVRL